MADGVAGLSTPELGWVSAQFDINTAADKAQWVAPFKCKIVRVFAVPVDGTTDAGGWTMKFDSVAAGSSTRGDGDIGTLTAPAASRESYYLYEEPSTLKTLDPGGQIFVEVTAESAAANTFVLAGIVYQQHPETLVNATYAAAV